MTEGLLESKPWLPAPTTPGPEDLPPGPRFGVWLLWLCFGLPSSAAMFLLIPGVIARFAVDMLDQAGVPLEAWSELEAWIGLTLLAAVVNHRASFNHRRKKLGEDEWVSARVWLIGGGVSALTWLSLFGLEVIPQTTINPELHYWALAAVMVWSGLSLAWVSGRVVSIILAPVERRALQSGPLRGSLATAGPLSMIALVAVSGGIFVDEDEGAEEVRALIESTFVDDWSPLDDASTGGGRGGSTSASEQPMSFNDCIEAIYAGDKGSLYWKGVRSISSYRGIDAESVAADAAIRVCSQPGRRRELRPYYRQSVQNGARTNYKRHRHFDTCSLDFEPEGRSRIPTGETLEDPHPAAEGRDGPRARPPSRDPQGHRETAPNPGQKAAARRGPARVHGLIEKILPEPVPFSRSQKWPSRTPSSPDATRPGEPK